MTNSAFALRPVSGPELETLQPLLAAVSGRALRLAPAAPPSAAQRPPRSGSLPRLRNADLLADMRRARAARFADRYESLALRRRRAQIAARHALQEGQPGY